MGLLLRSDYENSNCKGSDRGVDGVGAWLVSARGISQHEYDSARFGDVDFDTDYY
jgi:hypothetical protein